MKERRWAWYLSGVALVLAGFAAAIATQLWWLPCRGQMLLGAHLWSFPETAEFTEACLRRMDEGTAFPGPGYALHAVPGLLFCTVATVLLTAAGWLLPVLSLTLRPLVRLVLLLPGILTSAVGIVVAFSPEASPRDAPTDTRATEISTVLIEVLLLALLIAVPTALAARPGSETCHWILAGAAVNAFSIVGVATDYVLMGLWSEANWDSPPGSGYPTAGWLLLCGVGIIVLTRVLRPRTPTSAASAPQQVQQVDPVA